MKKKLIWLFLLVVCVPLILSVFITSYLVKRQMEETLANRMTDSLGVVDNLFEQFTEDIALKARLIAQTKEVQTTVAQHDTLGLLNKLSLLRHDLNLNVYEGVIEVYDQRGHLLAAEPKTDQQMAEPEMIQAALNSEVKQTLQFTGQRLKMVACLPLFQANQATPTGVIAVSFYISHKVADELKSIANSEVIIFSEPQATQSPTILTSTFTLNGERYLFTGHEQDLLPGQRNHFQVGNKQFMLKILMKQANNGNFVLGAALEKTELLQVVSSLQYTLYAIGLVAVLLALVLAYFLSGQLLNPINQLMKAAEALSQHNLSQPVVIQSHDEFAFLGQTFEKMRRDIKQMIEQLEEANATLDKKVFNLSVMNQINQAIINHSGNELFHEILSIIAKTMNAERSSILLKDKSTRQLMLKIVYKREDKGHKTKPYVSLLEGEGLAGFVVQTGQSLYSNAPLQDERFKKYESEDMNQAISNIACIPLQGDQEVLGVINVVNRQPGFQEEDIALLQHIAHQIAIAIQNNDLYELSITDGMTKLYIHRYFQAMLDSEIKRAQRYDMKLSLLMFDIDHFKKFNDTYGHQVGDLVIKKVAEIFKDSVREGIDTPARYGGEEFAVIMPGTDIDGALLLAERLRSNVENAVLEHDGQLLKVTVSLGCAEFPIHAHNNQELISKADEALYCSKRNGRNQVTKAS